MVRSVRLKFCDFIVIKTYLLQKFVFYIYLCKILNFIYYDLIPNQTKCLVINFLHVKSILVTILIDFDMWSVRYKCYTICYFEIISFLLLLRIFFKHWKLYFTLSEICIIILYNVFLNIFNYMKLFRGNLILLRYH